MAINPVSARIDVLVSGQQNLDRLATAYMRAQQMANSATRAVQGWNRSQNLTVRAGAGFLGFFNNFTSQIANHTNQVNAAGRATSSFHGNILRLTQSMILFSVLLPVVRLPETAIRSFQDFVQVGMEWQTQVRSINSLIQLQGEQYSQLDAGMRNLATTYALTNEEVGNAAKMIASTLGVVQRNTAGMTEAERAQSDFNLTMQMTNSIAELSRAAFEDMNVVTEAAFTIFATGQIKAEDMQAALDQLFRTVQVGRTTFAQFNKDAGNFMPLAQDWITATGDATQNFQRMTSVLQAFEAASLGLGSTRASVGLGQIFQAASRGTGEQEKIINRMQQLSKAQNLGERFDITDVGLMGAKDMQDYFGRLNRVLGQNSPIIDAYITKLRSQGKQFDEAAVRAAKSDELMRGYYGNVRASRAARQITDQVLGYTAAAHEAAGGEQNAFQEWLKNPKSSADRMVSAYRAVKEGVFDSIQKDVVSINYGLFTVLSNIQQAIGPEGAQKDLGFFQKIQFIADEMTKAFSNYYNTGGKQDIQTAGYNLGHNVAQAMLSFFQGGADNIFIQAAGSFVKQFTDAIGDQLPQLLQAVIQSSILKAVATYAVLKTAGAPGPLAALGTGIVMSTVGGGGQGGMAGNLMGLGALALGGTVAAKTLWGRQWGGTVGAGGVRTGGTNLGSIFGQLRGSAAQRVATAGYTGADYMSGAEIRALRASGGTVLGAPVNIQTDEIFEQMPGGRYTSRGVVPGIAQRRMRMVGAGATTTAAAGARGQSWMSNIFGRGGAIGEIPRLGRMRLGGSLLTAGVLGGLGLMQAMQENDDRSKWTSGVGTVGSVIGSLGLGALGALIPGLGPIGMMAGGMAGGVGGQWLGEKLGGGIYDLLNPKAAGATAALQPTGMGPGTEEAQNLAQVFMMGINASDLTSIMEQVNRKLDNPNRIGNVPSAGGGTTSTPGAGGGTGAGPGLTKSFVDQMNSGLSRDQASAACGPAAVDFFVRAYGRTPNLAEAYQLVQSFQPGITIATQGSNIGAMGQAISKFGFANEVYQGANIDWGRLAENAKAGTPSIVNIGKSGTFPGHFFQIGGWNPATNQFNVGISGTNVSKWGGKALMTPQEMMAMGPSLGAIYGTTAPTTAAAGTGPIDSSSHLAFVNSIRPYATATAAKLGINPDWLIAMAASESNWGAAPGNELFGMKGTGTAGQVALKTWERDAAGNPYQTTANFAAYTTPQDAFEAYAGLLQKNYPGALNQTTLGGFAGGLKAGGYYTDTEAHYQATLQGIIDQFAGATGFGPGGGGGAIQINGPLIGTVYLNGTATEDDANQLAAMVASALEDVDNLSGGGIIGQTKLVGS